MGSNSSMPCTYYNKWRKAECFNHVFFCNDFYVICYSLSDQPDVPVQLSVWVLAVCQTMDEQTKFVLRRIFKKIPSRNIEDLLKNWNCLNADQLRALDYTRPKWTLVENIISFCEVRTLIYIRWKAFAEYADA